MPHEVTGGGVASLAFGAVARARDDRALHPDGVVFAGAITGALFGARRALVRISRGGGLPETLPDVRGCAIRVLDAHGSGRHQDLLLASSLAAPVGRHL